MDKNTKGDNKGQKKMNIPDYVLKNKKVLVVDDDVRNINSLSKVLEELKMNVVTAIDGKEALLMLEEHNDINIVLLDMMMPNMDGYETATIIRKNGAYKYLPVIAVTAKAIPVTGKNVFKAGASDYITKPLIPISLLHC